jgi:hypothetical protein
MLQSIANQTRIITPSAVLIVLMLGCDSAGDADRDQRGICCECACSESGIPCLAIRVETVETEGAGSCPTVCEQECAAHPSCPAVEEITSCSKKTDDITYPPGGRGGGEPCGKAVDDAIDSCDQEQS